MASSSGSSSSKRKPSASSKPPGSSSSKPQTPASSSSRPQTPASSSSRPQTPASSSSRLQPPASSSSRLQSPASSSSTSTASTSSSSRPKPKPGASSSSRWKPRASWSSMPPPLSSKPPPPPASPSTMPLPAPSPIPKAPRKLPKEVDTVDGIAQTCWVKFREEATFALYTPFIVSLASGTLKVKTFRQCVAQDVHFLKPFAQAFESAEEYADDDDDKHGIKELRKTTIKKLNLHAQEWGSDVVKDTTLNPATSKCTDFLLATALGKIDGIKPTARSFTPFEKTKLSGYILGVMTSCIKLCAFIGKELQGIWCPDDQDHHPYKKWIENYSSDSFQEFCFKTEELLDNLSVAFTLEELGIIERLYSQGIKHEIDFFLAQPLIQKSLVPLSGERNLEGRRLMIFSGFDLTCTCVDSSASLAQISILTALKSDQIPTENQTARMSSSDLKHSWAVISKKYKDGYDQCIANILATKRAVKKLNYEGLQKALERVADFEKEANLRVIESGLLKGLDLKHIQRAGELMVLQDGCMNFFQTIKKKNAAADVYVLSYCWCGFLIRTVFSTGGIDDVKVHANELEFEESFSTGEIMKKVQSPIDKVEAFDKIIQESCGEGDDKKKLLSVYIGDSVGDLLCLLKADVGIVVGDSRSLKIVAGHFGVRFIPLFHGVVEKQNKCVEGDAWKGLSGDLYTVSSWAEIHAFVLGS